MGAGPQSAACATVLAVHARSSDFACGVAQGRDTVDVRVCHIGRGSIAVCPRTTGLTAVFSLFRNAVFSDSVSRKLSLNLYSRRSTVDANRNTISDGLLFISFFCRRGVLALRAWDPTGVITKWGMRDRPGARHSSASPHPYVCNLMSVTSVSPAE